MTRSRTQPHASSSNYLRLVALIASLFGVLCIWSLTKWSLFPTSGVSDPNDPFRLGGGILFLSGPDCLLLQRKVDNVWLVPGGHFNASTDLEVFNTAFRESTEKLGYLPQHELQDQLVVRWGPHSEKEFTVFLAIVNEEEKGVYLPRPDEDHLAAQWVPLEKLRAMSPDLHPVVQQLEEPFLKSKLLTVSALSTRKRRAVA